MTDAEFLASKLHTYSHEVATEMGNQIDPVLDRPWDEIDVSSKELMTKVSERLLKHDVALTSRLINIMVKQVMQHNTPYSEQRPSSIIAEKLAWILDFVIEEGFSADHLDAICHIIGLFNDCEESEKAIFAFSECLYEKYAK